MRSTHTLGELTRPPTDPVLFDRIRHCLRGALVSAIAFGVAAPWLATGGGPAFIACVLLAIATLAVSTLLLRRDGSTSRVVRLGEIGSVVVIAVSILGGATLGNRFTVPMIPVVVAMGTGAFVPWGTWPQARVAGFAATAVLVHLAWLGSGPSGYPALVSLLGIWLSVPMATVVARDRARIIALADARREADERFRSLAASTPEVFWWLTPDRQQLSFISEAFVQIWGRPIAAALENPALLWQTIHPADQPRMQRAVAGMHASGFDEEYRILRPDGSVRTVHCRAYLVADGVTGETRITGVTEDVTERRLTEAALLASERRYAGLVDNAPDPILTFDGAGRLRSANPATARLLGWSITDLTALGPFRFLRLVSPGTRPVAARVARDLALRGVAQPVEVEVVRSDGERVPVEANQRLVTSADGTVSVEMILRDVTERRRAEEAARLQTLNAHMEALRESGRRRLAQRLHDELAQPLAALRLEMSWVTQSLADERAGAREQTRNMSALVESVIGASRTMIADLHPSVLDDFGLAEAVRWQSREFEQKTRLACAVQIEQEEIRCSEASAVALFRTLQEALDAITRAEGSARVHVTLRESDGETVLTLRVTCLPGNGTTLPVPQPSPWEIERMRQRALRMGGDAALTVQDDEAIELEVRVLSAA